MRGVRAVRCSIYSHGGRTEGTVNTETCDHDAACVRMECNQFHCRPGVRCSVAYRESVSVFTVPSALPPCEIKAERTARALVASPTGTLCKYSSLDTAGHFPGLMPSLRA